MRSSARSTRATRITVALLWLSLMSSQPLAAAERPVPPGHDLMDYLLDRSFVLEGTLESSTYGERTFGRTSPSESSGF